MRVRNSLILAGLTALIAIGMILGGCSSDDDQPTTNANTDPTDQMIDAVTAQVSAQLDSAVSHFETGLKMSQVSSSGGIIDNGTDLRLVTLPGEEAEYSDGWYVWVEGDLGASLGDLQVDSMQYLSGQTVLEDALGADALLYKHAYVSNAADTTVDFENINYDSDLSFSTTDADTATITGTFDASLYSKDHYTDSTIWQNWDVQITLTDVQVAGGSDGWTSGCPCAGSAEVTVDYAYRKSELNPMVSSWTYSVTFDNGTIQVDVAKEDLNTSYEDQLCAQ